ncbi:isochorismate synthase [Burkholderia plantarii]|uniref:isochorismate synthase n=1 Tax=Burkholderia plantarii TaxID=41899 RepID=UPI0018DCD523|nr:isochorismate synthase [Burkholderia plantarii]MBI0328492.1 isochorismate synthase [Burkholderia plantarii]
MLAGTFMRAARHATASGAPVLASVSFPLKPLDLPALIGRWDDGATPWAFHETVTPSFALFGWDCALELSGHGDARFAQIDACWRELVRTGIVCGDQPPRLIGGFRFDPAGARHAHWQAFADASMMLPRLSIVRERGDHWLVCQHVAAPDDDGAAVARRYEAWIHRLGHALPASAPARGRGMSGALETVTLDADVWKHKVREAIDAIGRGAFSKVVLARDVLRRYPAPVAIAPLLARLRRRDANAQLFAVRRGGGGFVGATPERLVRVHERLVHTQALAGTTRRDADPDRDRALGAELMADHKERLEHAIVVEAIAAALEPHTHDLQLPDQPALQLLPRLQHLSTPIRATLDAGTTPLSLVAALHPTPAVAGHPRAAALAWLRMVEGFDRGWYASPFGWIDAHGNGDFCVALRCALIVANTCRLFAGCGIVAESDPEREYQETALKLSGMQAAIESPEDSPSSG